MSTTTTTRPRYSKRVQRRIARADYVIAAHERREIRHAERRLAKANRNRAAERAAAILEEV